MQLSKTALFICLFTVTTNVLKAQTTPLIAYFSKSKDTIKSNSDKTVKYAIEIIIPAQKKYKDAKISIQIDNRTDIPNIAVQDYKTFTVKEDVEVKEKLTFYFERNESFERTIKLKLAATAKDTAVKLKDSATTLELYVLPYKEITFSTMAKEKAEFWVFTGTNFDFLDGVKTKDLYFKGSLLTHIFSDKKLIYLTFGKNRYNSDRDSLYRISFIQDIPKATPGDSITIEQGHYSTFRQTTTDNIFSSVEYLYQAFKTQNSSFYLTAGLYFGLQTIKTSYNDYKFTSDTNTYARRKDSAYRFVPILREDKYKQANYNFSLGLMHILDLENLNVKTQLTTGLNALNYPYARIRTSTREKEFYETQNNLFVQLRMDATVLDPGISLGFETFIRKGQLPLFNVNLTKVIDFRKISSLFTPLQPLETAKK